MSPQKKPAAKPAARKVSKKIPGVVSKKITRKKSPKSLKKVSKKLSAVQNSPRLIEEMIDTIGAGVYLARQGKFVFVSPLYETLTGYVSADLIGKIILDYVHPDDRKLVQKSQKMQNRDSYEYRFIRKDGEIIWFLETSGPTIHQGTKAMLGSVMEITRHKQTGESIRLKEDRYSALLHEIRDNYFEDDLHGSFTFVNDALVCNLGYAKEELIGMNYRRYCDEETAERMRTLFTRIYETGQSFSGIEAQLIRKDGTKRFFEVSAALIRDEQGKPVGFRCLSRDISERRLMVEELRKSEARYRTILEDIEEGYLELDLEGCITFINPVGARAVGNLPEKLIGTDFRKLISEKTINVFLSLYKNIYKTGTPVNGFEVAFITHDGIERFIEISGALLRDSTGKPIGFKCLLRDITERKWSEDALLQSEAKYFSIIESIGEAYFETDLTGLNTFVNDKVCEALGYTRDELLRMSNRDQQDEANARKTYAAFNKIYQTGLPVNDFQYEAIRKDGTKVVFEMAISLMRDAQGKPIGFRGLARDITRRKEMEDALRASEERAHTLIATIPDPYIERDLQGNAIYVNDAYVAMTGYSAGELRNNNDNYSQYLDAENAEIVSSTYNAIIKTGLTMKNIDIELMTKSGEKRLVNLSASIVRDPHGNPTGIQSIIRDSTEKRKAEELIRQSEQALREYSETLELRVKERTAELEKAKVVAEVASRAKSDFMASVSHEFQTPLNAVIGFTKVLQDRMFGELNEKQEEFIRYIAEAGASLSRIITEILDATHAASGRAKLNIAPVSITDALSKTVRLLASQVKEKNQVLTVDVDLDAAVSIEADEQKIQQVFFHLLSNAVKYTAEGGKVDVRAFRASHPFSRQEGISVAIADTGIGIKAEDIPKLFQTFGTLESPYTRSEKGIGIGLSLTKQLVELHGGDISVESEFGKGSSFSIFLPLKQKQTGLME